jgi:hypothetical protein
MRALMTRKTSLIDALGSENSCNSEGLHEIWDGHVALMRETRLYTES